MSYQVAVAVFLLFRFASAEIVDRIAVSVGSQVITESELLRAIRVAAFVNDEKPDITSASKRKNADLLVERKLVFQELALSRYPEPPESEIAPALESLKRRFHNEEQYRRSLAEYRISEAELKQFLQDMNKFRQFTEMRFQPAVQVSEDDIRQRFERQSKGEADRLRNGQKLSYDDMRAQIEQELTSERINQELEAWVKAARSRVRVRYREEALK